MQLELLEKFLTFILAALGAGAGMLVVNALKERAASIREDKIVEDKLEQSEYDRLSALYDRLNGRVLKIEEENIKLISENRMLWAYIDKLRRLLMENNIEAPPLPELDRIGEKADD